MASTNLPENTKTRLQKETQKRKAQEQLKQDMELKRQKPIFALGKTSGLRDVCVDSNHQTVKLEYSSSESPFLKQEVSEFDSSMIEQHDNFLTFNLPKIKLESSNSFAVKVEETLDLEECTFTEPLNENVEQAEFNETFANQNDVKLNVNMPKLKQIDAMLEITSDSEEYQFLENYFDSLKDLVEQKDKEINLLVELIKGLFAIQSNVLKNDSSNNNSEKNQINMDNFSSNIAGGIITPSLSITKQVQQLTFIVRGKDIIIRELSTKMFKLQKELFGYLDKSFGRPKDCQPDTTCLNLLANIQCVQCAKIFKSKEALQKHKINCHTEPSLPCPYCKNKYHTEVQLSKHVKIHTNPEELKWQCRLCQTKFKKQTKLKKHLKIHVPLDNNSHEGHQSENLLDLNNASENILESETGFVMQNRKNDIHNKRQLLCPICGKQYKSIVSLNLHLKPCRQYPDRKFQCKECDRKFKRDLHLNTHMIMKHPTIERPPLDGIPS